MEMDLRNMTAQQHREFLMIAIKNRLERHNNYRNKCVGGQSDLASSDDEYMSDANDLQHARPSSNSPTKNKKKGPNEI